MPDAPGLELLRGEIDATPLAPSSPPPTSTEQRRPDRRPGAGHRRPHLAARHPWPGLQLPLQPPRRRLPARRTALRRPLRAAEPRAGRAHPGQSDAPGRLATEIDSCVELFPTANFQEREAFDFFGIVFRGHPELTRILLPEDYVGWPQRRDFPVGGEPVTFTYSEKRYG
ncbi:MAG: NADH-quinone oxidoreductase subunit C [Solirubrobacterales bacterium]